MLRDSVDGVVVTVGTTPSLQVPGPDPAGTQRLTVEGHPARFRPVRPDHPYAELVVTLDNGRSLTVSILHGGGRTSATATDPAAGPTAVSQPSGPTLPADETTVIALAKTVRWKVPSFA